VPITEVSQCVQSAARFDSIECWYKVVPDIAHSALTLGCMTKCFNAIEVAKAEMEAIRRKDDFLRAAFLITPDRIRGNKKLLGVKDALLREALEITVEDVRGNSSRYQAAIDLLRSASPNQSDNPFVEEIIADEILKSGKDSDKEVLDILNADIPDKQASDVFLKELQETHNTLSKCKSGKLPSTSNGKDDLSHIPSQEHTQNVKKALQLANAACEIEDKKPKASSTSKTIKKAPVILASDGAEQESSAHSASVTTLEDNEGDRPSYSIDECRAISKQFSTQEAWRVTDVESYLFAQKEGWLSLFGLGKIKTKAIKKRRRSGSPRFRVPSEILNPSPQKELVSAEAIIDKPIANAEPVVEKLVEATPILSAVSRAKSSPKSATVTIAKKVVKDKPVVTADIKAATSPVKEVKDEIVKVPKVKKITKAACLKDAKNFASADAWNKASPLTFKAAFEHGVYDYCVAHMRPKWTPEACLLSAKLYNTVQEWQKSHASARTAAFRLGNYDACTAHMSEIGRRKRKKVVKKTPVSFIPSTRSEVFVIASEYNTVDDWQKGHPESFNQAKALSCKSHCVKLIRDNAKRLSK